MAFSFKDFRASPAVRLATPILEGFARGMIGLDPVKASPAYNRSRMAGATISDNVPRVLEAMNSPSITVELDDEQNTVIRIRRNTQYMEMFQEQELQAIRELGDLILRDLINHSRGPYTQKMLDKAGNPYGWQLRGGARTSLGRSVPRRLGGKSIGHSAGVRGSAPVMSVINKQSGRFLESWRFGLVTDGDGYTMEFRNEAKTDKGAPYPWFLAHGTQLMQPHGPWTQVPMTHLTEINSLHARAVREAHGRFQSMQELVTSSLLRRR